VYHNVFHKFSLFPFGRVLFDNATGKTDMTVGVNTHDSAPLARFPRRFGPRYVLLKELARGGRGEVFMAVSGQAGVARVSALKIVRDFKGDHGPEEITQRFLDEAQLVTKLSHENLVYVFDFGILDRRGYLAMEYVAGKTLGEVWNRCVRNGVGFPIGVSLFLISELAAALGYAHREGGLGLVHRDISPSNLMLSYTGGLKLIDFGLAKWKSKLAETATGVNWGKVQYMSPEQYTGRAIDNRSDLYSSGVILWELLTGRPLYPSPEARAENQDIAPPSGFHGGLSPAIDRLLLRALAPRPGDRFQSGEEMNAAILRELPRDAGKLQVAEFMEKLFAADRNAEAVDQAAQLAAAAALGDRIYVFSGTGPGQGDTPVTEEYDPATNTWRRRPPIPTPRNHHAAVALAGKIYTFVGRGGGRNINVTEIYDPATDAWTTGAPIPTARSGIAAAALGGRIYVFGGELGRPTTYPENEMYDPGTNMWSARAPMPTPRHGLAAVAVGDRIYVTSGGPRPGGSFSNAHEVFIPEEGR
jgi:serine/threonine-protein kinase